MMLKKYKILVLMIVLSLVGFVGIISVWLYDNYLIQREMLVSDVERGLFNAIQLYYEDHQIELDKKRQNVFRKEQLSFTDLLKNKYPDIDTAKVREVWDSVEQERLKRFANRSRYREVKEDGPSSIIPSFMLQNIDFKGEALEAIGLQFRNNLLAKGIDVKVDIYLEVLKDRPFRGKRMRNAVQADGFMQTRPTLVNPLKNEFLVAKFEVPVLYILSKMAFQLVLSIMLIVAILSTFIYLLCTINRQNRLALLRKSFVNNMTHELKTPVATVMAAVEAVQSYGAKDDKDRMIKYLDISKKELTHLAGMIDQFMEFEVDESIGLHLNKIDVDVVELLNTSAESIRLNAKKQVEINVTSSNDHILINIDESHIRNVFTNLLDNAIKYSGSTVVIDIALWQDKNVVNVKVSDNGIGIDSGYHKDIFDMFFRVPNGNLHPVKGFGLGLSYVKQVIEQHTGQIKVNSKLDEGTTFLIILPIK